MMTLLIERNSISIGMFIKLERERGWLFLILIWKKIESSLIDPDIIVIIVIIVVFYFLFFILIWMSL